MRKIIDLLLDCVYRQIHASLVYNFNLANNESQAMKLYFGGSAFQRSVALRRWAVGRVVKRAH